MGRREGCGYEEAEQGGGQSRPDPEVIRSTALGPGHTITIGSVFVVYTYLTSAANHW